MRSHRVEIAVILFSFSMGLAVAQSADAEDCRDLVRQTDKVALHYRKAARAVAKDCKEDVARCDAAISSLGQALNALNDSSATLVDGCKAVIGPTPGTPGPGDLVITEINVVSSLEAGARYQWFEVYNPTSTALDLSNVNVSWTDEQNIQQTGTIEPGVSVPSQGFRVIAFEPDSLLAAFDIQNAGKLNAALSDTGSQLLGGFSAGSAITITSSLGEVDTASWGFSNAFSSTEADKSRQLDPDAFDASLNDQVNVPNETNACTTPDPLGGQCVWCQSTLTYGTTTNTAYGTPGADNTECAGVGSTP
jgi:hypothetical protein